MLHLTHNVMAKKPKKEKPVKPVTIQAEPEPTDPIKEDPRKPKP